MDCILLPYVDGEWISVNANLKYCVKGGIVFVAGKIIGGDSNWHDLGQLPQELGAGVEIMYTIDARDQSILDVNNYAVAARSQTANRDIWGVVSYPLA